VLRWTCGEIPLGEAELAWVSALAEGASAAALGPEAAAFMRRLLRHGLLEPAL
jgi:hypothetical protein